MKQIKFKMGYGISAITALAAVLLMSCGSSAYKEPAQNSTMSQNYSPTPTPSSTSGTGGTTGSTGSTGSTSNFLPAYTASFTVTGSNGATPSYSIVVDTDNILKIRITAGASTNVIPGSNFSASYECVTYKVSALGQTLTTKTLSVTGGNGLCQNAPTSQVLDFSNRLTSGHGPVTVSVQASGYDFYCQGCLAYPWLYNAYPYGYYSCNMYCPLHTVYQNHGVTGTLDIQTNGTTL